MVDRTSLSMVASALSVRFSSEERAILEAASEQAHISLSEFVRRKALEAAETDILERQNITVPVEDWEAFEAWMKRPAQEIPVLRELASRKSSFTPPSEP